MRWRRVSSPRSNASCSIGADSRRRPRRASPSSNSSRASTIRDGGTHRLGISPRSTTSAATTRERLIPAHTIVPPCSGRSRCGLEMLEYVSTPARRPTLTAPARAGVRDVWAGTEKRTLQGPNRKTAVNRRTRCRHFRYLEPNPSPLHETGASPTLALPEGRARLIHHAEARLLQRYVQTNILLHGCSPLPMPSPILSDLTPPESSRPQLPHVASRFPRGRATASIWPLFM